MSFRKVATATVGIIVLVVAVAGLNYSADDKSDAGNKFMLKALALQFQLL